MIWRKLVSRSTRQGYTTNIKYTVKYAIKYHLRERERGNFGLLRQVAFKDEIILNIWYGDIKIWSLIWGGLWFQVVLSTGQTVVILCNNINVNQVTPGGGDHFAPMVTILITGHKPNIKLKPLTVQNFLTKSQLEFNHACTGIF